MRTSSKKRKKSSTTTWRNIYNQQTDQDRAEEVTEYPLNLFDESLTAIKCEVDGPVSATARIKEEDDQVVYNTSATVVKEEYYGGDYPLDFLDNVGETLTGHCNVPLYSSASSSNQESIMTGFDLSTVHVPQGVVKEEIEDSSYKSASQYKNDIKVEAGMTEGYFYDDDEDSKEVVAPTLNKTDGYKAQNIKEGQINIDEIEAIADPSIGTSGNFVAKRSYVSLVKPVILNEFGQMGAVMTHKKIPIISNIRQMNLDKVAYFPPRLKGVPLMKGTPEQMRVARPRVVPYKTKTVRRSFPSAEEQEPFSYILPRPTPPLSNEPSTSSSAPDIPIPPKEFDQRSTREPMSGVSPIGMTESQSKILTCRAKQAMAYSKDESVKNVILEMPGPSKEGVQGRPYMLHEQGIMCGIRCVYCSDTTASIIELSDHIGRRHTDVIRFVHTHRYDKMMYSPFQCTLCPCSSFDITYLMRHWNIVRRDGLRCEGRLRLLSRTAAQNLLKYIHTVEQDMKRKMNKDKAYDESESLIDQMEKEIDKEVEGLRSCGVNLVMPVMLNEFGQMGAAMAHRKTRVEKVTYIRRWPKRVPLMKGTPEQMRMAQPRVVPYKTKTVRRSADDFPSELLSEEQEPFSYILPRPTTPPLSNEPSTFSSAPDIPIPPKEKPSELSDECEIHSTSQATRTEVINGNSGMVASDPWLKVLHDHPHRRTHISNKPRAPPKVVYRPEKLMGIVNLSAINQLLNHLPCPICNDGCPSMMELETHVALIHPTFTITFVCGGCTKEFSGCLLVKGHLIRHKHLYNKICGVISPVTFERDV